MAENKRPSIMVDSPPRHINFATIKKQGTISKNHNKVLQSPMAGDRNYNAGGVDPGNDRLSVVVDTARMQLISPPPEEMLRKNPRLTVQFTPSLLANTDASPVDSSLHDTTSVVKRKRTRPAPPSSTPSSSRGMDSVNQDNDLGTQSPSPLEATPNPKPRKQGRLHSRQPSFESPTRTSFGHLGSSPGARSSRRNLTPIPSYEPPSDIFTPPREVFITPVLTKAMSKSSKRKTIPLASSSKSAKGKKKGSTLTIVTTVKQELPDIDLSLPMPPPSPTDDPLLLLGPPEFDPEPTPRTREMSVQAQAEQELNGYLPPSSPEPLLTMDDVEAVRVFNWNRNENAAETSTDDSIMQLDPDDADISPVRLFDLNNLPPSSNGGWSDSDNEELAVTPGRIEGGDEGEGEYTGRWRTILVPTKQDPPSSATRGRMEEWGRPISPFPKKVSKLAFLEEEGEERRQEMDHQPVGSQEEEEYMRREEEEQEEEEQEEEEVRRMSVEPMQQSPRGLVSDIEEQEEEEEQEVRQMSVEFDGGEEPASPLDDLNLVPPQFTENAACRNQAVSIPASQPPRQPSPAPAIELFVFPSIGPSPEAVPSPDSTTLEHGITPASAFNESQQAEDDDQSSDDDEELSLVKITSANPRAAARAAAILKQHDYDCYTNIEVKQRHIEAKQRRNSHSDIEDFAKEFRRRDVSSSGIAKGSNSCRRRSTLGMGMIGDRVFIPGSPAITLPELLHEAELEVRDSPQRLLILAGKGRGDPFKTPIPVKHRSQTANTRMADPSAEVYGSDIGEREWTKEDWRHLDACFTDQRLEVGSRLPGAEENLLAPVDLVSINDVVDKFVISKGGFETVARFGALWSRENLLERTRALQKKQRSGHIAPPTTPYTPLSVSSDGNVLGGKERAPRMQVPDFTPLRHRAPPPRKSRSILQKPLIDDIASKDSTQEKPIVPPTLLAPRYSHLLEEAIAVSQQGSILLPEQETQDSFTDSEIEETPHSDDVPSKTIGKCVKGFIFSYLPTLPKSSSVAKKTPNPVQPSLPIPPDDILSKPRGPVTTPARVPLSKPKHPKELVVLNPAPQPSTVSHIPRVVKPRRLVELHPPPLPIEPTPIPRPRRSSGSSVKDLVRGFEEIQALSKPTKSNKKKPQWKP